MVLKLRAISYVPQPIFMTTDSVADALIRIKNGYLARGERVSLPYSKLVVSICQVLVKEGYLSRVEELSSEKNGFKQLVAILKYDNKQPVLTDVKRVSKPGLRVYKGKLKLPYVLNGLGIALISTPKGIMTDKQARKDGLGGEIMAFVW